jgi:hypothetical protein
MATGEDRILLTAGLVVTVVVGAVEVVAVVVAVVDVDAVVDVVGDVVDVVGDVVVVSAAGAGSGSSAAAVTVEVKVVTSTAASVADTPEPISPVFKLALKLLGLALIKLLVVVKPGIWLDVAGKL